jgi:UDP-galactopyranose mutase
MKGSFNKIEQGMSSNGQVNTRGFQKGNGRLEGNGKLASSRERAPHAPGQGGAFASTDNYFDADLICFSHLRWDFVYQRPQHLLSRCARERRVFFVEEPIFGDGSLRLDVSRRDENLFVVVPRLPEGLMSEVAVEAIQHALVDRLISEQEITDYVLWYYTPMALGWTRHLQPRATVYDCMDELSAFKFAPRSLRDREAELLRRADVVFTGGQSLYEAKRDKHSNIHAFPSSIDREHFAQAREMTDEPADQASIPRPRMGFFGVVDERFDTRLLDEMAAARPDWQFVVIGPVVKISEGDLPRRANIHYLGGKSYQELPRYIAGWDVAALLFARNEHTRFISPTKTPEYLAAGKPIVSTSIRDVVRPYGELGLVQIADNAADFITAAAEAGMDKRTDDAAWLARVDEFLARNSWDETWGRMATLIGETVEARKDVERKAKTARAAIAAQSASPVTQPAPRAAHSTPLAARVANASSFTAAD